MRRALAVLLLALMAGPALAQVSNPFLPQGQDEGVSQGRFSTLNLVGANISCARVGLVYTCTISGPALGGANVWTSTNSFIDTNFTILGSADATKIGRFEADTLIPTGTTRIYTLPNGNTTLGGLAVAGTWTAAQQFDGLVMSPNSPLSLGSSASTNPWITHWNVQVPAQGGLLTGSVGNAWVIAESADFATNGALPQQTNPTLAIFAASYASGTNRMLLRHNQTQGQVVDGAAVAANARPVGLHGGSAVASAGTITPTGNVFHVTGTTTITSVTAMAAGTEITIIFDGILTFTDGSNLVLAGNFVTTADDVIRLACDGTNWYETGRSVN